MARNQPTPDEVLRSGLVRREQPHGWAPIVSIALHALLFAGLAVGSIVGSCGPSFDGSQKPIAAKLVRLGKPRDPKLLPRKPTAPAVEPTAKEAPVATPGKEVAPEPPKPTVDPKPETVPALAAKPNDIPSTAPTQAAAPKNPPKAEKKSKLDDIMKRFSTGAVAGPAEELPGQLDGDPEGDAEQAEEGERYLALLVKRIKEQYQLPSTISDQERMYLKATLTIIVERNGRIARWEIARSSGNAIYDSAVEAAVKRAGSVPPPPDHMVAMMRGGIDLNFTP